MSLRVTNEAAKSSIATLQERSAVVSRNIANANADFATRKIAHVVSAPGGGVRLASIERAADQALFNKVLVANSVAGGQQEIVRALDQLNETVGDPELDASPAALIGELNASLQQLSAAPQDPIRQGEVLNKATDLANALNAATETVQTVRAQTDAEIGRTVDRVNTILQQIEEVNVAIVNGTRIEADVTDQMDTRDKLLSDLSTEIGIRVVPRANNDIAVFTDSGITLFDATARTIEFDPTPVFDATTTGSPLIVDGVAVTGPSASMEIGAGRLTGLVAVRDTIAVTYQNQLDEIARGLIETFAETDQTGSGQPNATGIFTYSGSPTVPATGTIVTGLAGEIAVNAAIDPDRGGDLDLIRDGGINGSNYVYNTSGSAGFSTRILQLADGLETNRAFDPTAEAGSDDSLADFAATSVGWLQQVRQEATADLEFAETVQVRATDAFTQISGVNLDLELTILLEIERTFQASSRILSAVDRMFQSLLEVA